MQTKSESLCTNNLATVPASTTYIETKQIVDIQIIIYCYKSTLGLSRTKKRKKLICAQLHTHRAYVQGMNQSTH
jgi:hypothetical protein